MSQNIKFYFDNTSSLVKTLDRYKGPPYGRVPRSLARLPIWFATESYQESPNSQSLPTKVRYSPVSLSPLRSEEVSDYSTFNTALEAIQDHFWLNGLGIRFAPPLLTIVIENCVRRGKVEKSVRDLTKRIGGTGKSRLALPIFKAL